MFFEWVDMDGTRIKLSTYFPPPLYMLVTSKIGQKSYLEAILLLI